MSENDKITIRQFCADYHGVAPEDVTSDHIDPVVYFLNENSPADGPAIGGVWLLDAAEQAAARADLDGRDSGAIIEEYERQEDPWDEFIEWGKRFYEGDRFEVDERTWKLEIVTKIRTAQEAVAADAEDWFPLLKKAFGSPNSLTFFITHTKYLDWAEANPLEARDALIALWDESRGLEERISRFLEPTPQDLLVSPSSRLQIASFLLTVDPSQYVIFRPTPFKRAASLVEYPKFPDGPESAIYFHALEFIDVLIEKAAARGLDLRDRLDAQGIIWSVTKNDGDLTDEELEALNRYRGDSPSVWWVNQGINYEKERELGVVSAPIENKAGHDLQHWKNVELLRKGDVIVHYANGGIRAISEVSHRPDRGPLTWFEGDREGRITRTKYHDLTEPIAVREIDAERRTPEAGPFDRYGGVKQVYLVELSVTFSTWLRDTYQQRWPDGSRWAADQKNTWLFQANPSVWDFSTRLAEMDLGDEDDWSVSRFKQEIALGDRILLWQSGPDAGLYAIGEISGPIFERDPDAEHFTAAAEELAVPFRLTRKIDPPVLRSRLLEHAVLKGLSVITAPQGSNFRITDEQWTELRKLLDGAVPGELKLPEEEPELESIEKYIADQGLIISGRTLRRFHVSLRTRGFVILSGISGTGKTWLTEAYSAAIHAEYLLVPVAPNWTTNEDLLGYLNPLDNVYHDTVFSQFLRDAADEYEAATKAQRRPKPFLLTLDEMNLARVEYYFAKFLSAMEVRSRRGTADIELAPNQQVQLTPNLLFVGTVNIDETTHGFADKVFDRAQVIELEAPRDALAAHIGKSEYGETLLEVYEAVAEARPFAFRVVDEVKSYVGESDALDVEWHEAIDEQILQKVLTKLSGADPAIRFALERLVNLANEHGFKLTYAKAQRMLDDYDRHGFTSYF